MAKGERKVQFVEPEDEPDASGSEDRPDALDSEEL